MKAKKTTAGQGFLDFSAVVPKRKHRLCGKRTVVIKPPDVVGCTAYCTHCKLYIHPVYEKEAVE
jgi:hypothetical protein